MVFRKLQNHLFENLSMNSNIVIETNEYQTQLTEKLLSELKDEVRTDLLDMINNVEFIRRLIDPNRLKARDLQRDSSGKILVDLTRPHILEDMRFFTQSAIHFQKYGCYTKLMPNPNPQSEFGQ